MFDIGFWEMAFIGIIALVVIGPERLPGVAHKVGMWVGKSRRMLSEVMTDVKKEIKEYDIEQVKTLDGEFKSASKQLNDMTQSTSAVLGLKELGNEFKKSIEDVSDMDSPARQKSNKTSLKSKKKTVSGKTTPDKTTTHKKTARKKPITKKKTTTRKSTRKTTLKKPTTRKKATSKQPAIHVKKKVNIQNDGEH